MAHRITRLIRRTVIVTAVVVGSHLSGALSQPAEARPMCKVANEQDSQLPRAYMYSILFKMGMMFSLGGGVGYGMYLLGRKENAAIEELEHFASRNSGTDPNGMLPVVVQPATT